MKKNYFKWNSLAFKTAWGLHRIYTRETPKLFICNFRTSSVKNLKHLHGFVTFLCRSRGTRMASASSMETVTTWKCYPMAEPVCAYLLSCLKMKGFTLSLPVMWKEMPYALQSYMLNLSGQQALQVISHHLKWWDDTGKNKAEPCVSFGVLVVPHLALFVAPSLQSNASSNFVSRDLVQQLHLNYC